MPPPTAGNSFDGFAIAALITGLIPCTFFLGVILGIVALVRIGKSRQRGKGLAIAGIILGALWLVAIVLAVIFVDPDEKAATDLKVGDCFDKPSEISTVESVHSTKCSEPHDSEVFAVIDLPGDDFPGTATVSATAQQRCTQEFRDFVGVGVQESELGVYYLVPTDEVWKQGEHSILCWVTDPAKNVTGTLKGANR
jgi:hypothetical protein